ncbi:hypothetical protein BK133_26750 [Paenibacillus sp. FSL H8-0548]|uniref:ABC transporter substrate-binding protein n=1 Tax=Paenibacillus sp. FSL H8-0548 TaxID=1920422 RepID=UPI00096BDC17|nr:extracellular solute-binding protein [Paenibacillus sp. FSL H8-0548]OMF22240.1 hypothetical protein BK133_26750 [Paenibacillus sp. FSL H8-0548]
MFRNWLKSSAVVLTAAAMLLTGCGSSAGNKAGSDGAPVEIKVHTWYNLKNENFDIIKQEFEKQYPNIEVTFVSAGDNNATEAVKKVDLAAASGENMDVIMFSQPSFYVQRVALGMLEPLDDYLNKDNVKFEDEYSVNTLEKGKIYALPGKSVNMFVAINENHLKEAGLPVPTDWTWDDFLDYSKKLTKLDGEKKRYGTYFHSWTNPYSMIGLINQPTNAYLVTDDGKLANITNPIMKKSMEVRLQAEKDKSATPYAEVISQKLNYRPQYFNQDASMIVTGTFFIPETGGTEKVPAAFRTVFAPYPKINKDDQITTSASADIVSMYSKSKHKEEAYTFIRWFTTQGLVVQGRNIPSWKKADMNEVLDKIIAGTSNSEMIDKESALSFLENSKMIPTINPPAFSSEVEKTMQEEFDKMMLQGQDVDATLNTAQEKIQKLIDSNS